MPMRNASETGTHRSDYTDEARRLVFDDSYDRVHAPIARVLSDPIFDPASGLNLDQAGELAYQRARVVHREVGGPGDLVRDPLRLFALAEWPSLVDVSVFSLLMVHYNLCFGTLYDHGRHRDDIDDYVRELDELRAFGPYMATELGYGNNVAALQTRARFDPQRDVFVLTTPDAAAQKYMSYSGFTRIPKIAVVLARLEVAGEDCGVFPFVVRISDENGLRPGIYALPCPEKPVQGLDNGLTWFDDVELPRRSLLHGDIGQIDAEGRFSSRTANARRRFLKSMSRIYPGRLCVSSAAVGAARASIYLAVRFSRNRMTNAPGRDEVPVMAHASHARPLYHCLAKVYAMTALMNAAKRRYLDAGNAASPELNVLISVTKVLTTWESAEVVGTCRERCGAQGMFSVNRIADYVSLLQGLITAEGDNKVLLSAASALLPTVLERAEQSPDPADRVGPAAGDWIGDLFDTRLKALQAAVGERQNDPANADYFEAWNAVAADALESTRMYGVKLAYDRLAAMSRAAKDVELQEGLSLLAQLYALHEIQDAGGWAVAAGTLSAEGLREIPGRIDAVCARLDPHVDRLVEGFELSPDLLRAPIGYDTYMDKFQAECERTAGVRATPVQQAV